MIDKDVIFEEKYEALADKVDSCDVLDFIKDKLVVDKISFQAEEKIMDAMIFLLEEIAEKEANEEILEDADYREYVLSRIYGE